MAFLDGEESIMIDMTLPVAAASPSDDAYLASFGAPYGRRGFQLFELPRELRDAIYDYALVEDGSFKVCAKAPAPSEDSGGRDATPGPEDRVDEASGQSGPSSPGIQATIKHRPFTNLLLASHTLKAEYEERAQNAMLVVLKDHDRYAFSPFKLPEQANKVQNFELHLVLFCHSCTLMSHFDEKTCHAALELNQHQIWINKMLPDLQNLRSLDVNAYISHDRYRSESKEVIPCERVVLTKFQQFRSLTQVRKLSLYKYDYNGYPDLDGPKAAVWRWTARDGVTKIEEKPAPPKAVDENNGGRIETDEDQGVSA